MGTERPRNDSAARRGNGFLGGELHFGAQEWHLGQLRNKMRGEGGMIGASKGREGGAADKRRGGTT